MAREDPVKANTAEESLGAGAKSEEHGEENGRGSSPSSRGEEDLMILMMAQGRNIDQMLSYLLLQLKVERE